jgi:site-specific recombinase XerD
MDTELEGYRDWLKLREKARLTINKYVREAERFLCFSRKNITSITKQDVIDYKTHLTAIYKPVSVNSALIALNQLFAFLGDDSLRVKTVKIQRKHSLNNVLSEEEYAALVRVAYNCGNIRLYYLMRVLASSGIRISELRYVTVGMLETGMTIVHNKTKAREVIIPTALRAELRCYCTDCGLCNLTDLVFHGKRRDVLIDKAYIWRDMRRTAEIAGVPPEKVHAHNFRHLFAKKFLAQYHDIVDLADILGHNSIETTRIYTRTSGQEKQNRIDGLNL